MQSAVGGQHSQSAIYLLTSAYLPPASSEAILSSGSRSSQNLYSSSVSIHNQESGTRVEILAAGTIGVIVVAVLVVTVALVILLTISTYVYCTKKRKGKYQHTEAKDSQVAVVSYHIDSKDAISVSYEEPADHISPQKSVSHTTSSYERSYRESFRSRGVSLPNQ